MPVGIGLLGCGTVGGGVAQLLVENAAAIARTGGVPFALRAVAIRNLAKPRPPMLDHWLLTTDAAAVVDREDIGLVIECIGGTGIARTLFGRERPIPDMNSRNPNARGFAERTAVNSPLQGTAADLI